MKYRVDVATYGDTHWASNALRFDTEDEAEAYAADLTGRWLLVEQHRVVPETTPEREAVES